MSYFLSILGNSGFSVLSSQQCRKKYQSLCVHSQANKFQEHDTILFNFIFNTEKSDFHSFNEKYSIIDT